MSRRWTWPFALLLGCSAPDPSAVPRPEGRSFREDVIYQIVVDRFDNGDPSNDEIDGVGPVPGDLSRVQGGDFKGITRRLDYLQALGATTLWISPIVKNVARRPNGDGYHGYWASDFTRVNPFFGSEQDLVELVDEAHARGMRVLFDVVVNHAGNVFYYDLDGDQMEDPGEGEPGFSLEPIDVPVVDREGPVWMWAEDERGRITRFSLDESAFHRQGRTENFSSPNETERGDFPTGLRDLATDDPALMDALITTYAEWVERTGADGFRLDAVPHVPREDWKRFCTGLRERLLRMGKTEFFLLGEVFRTEPRELASYTVEGALDSVFDFTFKANAVDRYLLEGGPATLARNALETARAAYGSDAQPGGIGLNPWEARVTFLDNHDVPRVGGRLDDKRAIWLALTLLFTSDGIPALYYGTEQGFTGQDGHEAREPLWESAFDQEHETFVFISRLSQLRAEHHALTHGDLIVRYASEHDGFSDAKDAGLFAFERADGQERLLIVINGHASQQSTLTLDSGFASGTVLADLLGSPLEVKVGEGGRVELTLDPRSAVILTN